MIARSNFLTRSIDSLVEKIKTRWASGWRDALASAIAAALAWILAVHFLGHEHPVFAAISAVVCLAPGLPSHGKQAVGLMVGVATGIFGKKVCITSGGAGSASGNASSPCPSMV